MPQSSIRLRLFMRLEAIDEDGNLTADTKRVKAMAEAILSSPVLAAIGKGKVDDRAAKKVTAKTRAALAATGKDSMIEYFDQPDDHTVFAQLDLREPKIELRVVVEPLEVEKHRATALDELVAAFVRALAVWRGVATLDQGQIKVEYAGTSPPYARMRNPRVNPRYPQRSLVTFLDPRNTSSEDVKRLLAPPPAHATITKHGDVVEVRWTKSLDDDAIARASTWHDCWIRRSVTEPDRNFNEHGDERVLAGNAKPKAPLTLYNPWWKRGFKAVLVTPEGELEESAWNDALSVLKARAFPDGEPIEKLWIVVPLREHAIAVHDRVVAAGFEAAVYAGPRDFWDPVPPGPWLSESTDVGAATRSEIEKGVDVKPAAPSKATKKRS